MPKPESPKFAWIAYLLSWPPAKWLVSAHYLKKVGIWLYARRDALFDPVQAREARRQEITKQQVDIAIAIDRGRRENIDWKRDIMESMGLSKTEMRKRLLAEIDAVNSELPRPSSLMICNRAKEWDSLEHDP